MDVGTDTTFSADALVTCKPREPVWPTVVVIIPFYNGAYWVERAIKSVIAQTIEPDEFIVVNDGSKQDERVALGKLAERYPFRIIDKPNGGQGSARNAGVAASKSDFICFLDQDDFYLDDHIEVLINSIPPDDRRLGFIYGDAVEADGEGNVVRSSMVKEHAAHPKNSILDMLRNDMFVLPSASMIRREAYESVGGFDEQFTGYEDDDLFMRIFRKGYTNHFVDQSVYVWRIHPDSTSYSIRMSRSRFRYFLKLTSLFPDDKSRARFYLRDCFVPRFARSIIADAVKASLASSKDREEAIQILVKFSKIVAINPYVKMRYKKKLQIMAWVLSVCPTNLLLTARKTIPSALVRRFIG